MRAHRLALAVILLAASAIVLPALLKGEVFVVRDHLDYFQPLRWFTAQELKAGRLPLWNPYSASGEPWLANPQTGVFYPPAWLFVILPFPAAYMLFLLLHLAVLGWGAYLLFARTVSQGAALVGAVAVVFAGPTLSLLDINNNLATFSWLPLVLWCAAEKAWRRGALALALAFLGGEPFFAATGALMFAVVAARSMRVVALAGLGAFGLSAIQLFPFLDAIRHSDRAGGLSPELILHNSMPLADWWRVAIPGAFAGGGQQFIPVVYAGVVVAALALIGLASIRRPPVAGWLVLLAFAALIGAGPAFLAKLPLTLFRYPARMVPLGALAIAALAAAGWERIRRPDKRWLDLLLVLLVMADLLPRARPLLASAPFTREVVPYRKEIGAELKLVTAGEVVPQERAHWVSGYLNLYDRRFDVQTAAPFENDRYRRFAASTLIDANSEQLAFLSGGFVLASKPMPPGLRPVARAGGVTVYWNPRAWPQARLAGNRRIVPARVEMDTRSARIAIDAPFDGTVVLAQQLAPGWRVFVDGEEREAVAVRGVFRGVKVEKGRREVVWRYRPRALIAGVAVTLVTALVIAISTVVKSRR